MLSVHVIRGFFRIRLLASKTVVTTIRFNCHSTALRPFDDLRYGRRPTYVQAAALRPK